MKTLELPKLETKSFYHPYQPRVPGFRPNVESYKEYLTPYIDYQYDGEGHCEMVVHQN